MDLKRVRAASDWTLVRRLLRLPSPAESGEVVMILSVLGEREALGRIGYLDFPTYMAWREWAERMYTPPFRKAFKALIEVQSDRR